MTPSELLLEGVELMLFGLGFVFLFLILLGAMIRFMSWAVELLESKNPAPAAVTPIAKFADEAPSAELLAAIQTAIHQHRDRRG